MTKFSQNVAKRTKESLAILESNSDYTEKLCNEAKTLLFTHKGNKQWSKKFLAETVRYCLTDHHERIGTQGNFMHYVDIERIALSFLIKADSKLRDNHPGYGFW